MQSYTQTSMLGSGDQMTKIYINWLMAMRKTKLQIPNDKEITISFYCSILCDTQTSMFGNGGQMTKII